MATIGYAQLISRLSLAVRPLTKPAEISGSVNRRVDSADRVLFPRGVAIEVSFVLAGLLIVSLLSRAHGVA